MSINGSTILQLLFSAGVTTVIVALINGYLQRRKTGADTTKIITDAAEGVMSRIESDNARLRAEADTHRTREHTLELEVEALQEHIEKLIQERFVWIRMIRHHTDWDEEAVLKVRAGGGHILDPPPLVPPDLVPRHPDHVP